MNDDEPLNPPEPIPTDTPVPAPWAKDLHRLVYVALFSTICTGIVALLILNLCYIRNPGSAAFLNRFSIVYLSTCLFFELIQLVILVLWPSPPNGRIKATLSRAYWLGIATAGLVSGIAYAFAHKPQLPVIQLLSGVIGLWAVVILRRQDPLSNEIPPGQQLPTQRWGVLAKALNRLLKFVHWTFSVFFASGAITLSLQYQYQNPGVVHRVLLSTKAIHSLNIYCTSPTAALNRTAHPTIWFQSSPAHGITDFLGVQNFLTTHHGRESCSYDPPGFGWSDAADVHFSNSPQFLPQLLHALGRQNEPRILAGWGAGTEDAIRHALAFPNQTKGVVLLDGAPDGIEWFDARRANNWSEPRMLSYKKQVLAERIGLVRTILTLGFSWGLMPIFFPNDPSKYYDKTLYPRHRAQSLKDNMWAFQYYALLSMQNQPISSFLANTTLPSQVRVYAIMTNDSNPTDQSSSIFQRGLKVNMISNLAGGMDKVAGWQWCVDKNCSMDFPVSRAEWTADALVELGI